VLPLIRHADGDFARNYDVPATSVFVLALLAARAVNIL
jgi:hypothetical protein